MLRALLALVACAGGCTGAVSSETGPYERSTGTPESATFPIRAAFYNSTYPEAWSGTPTPFSRNYPSLGLYRSDEPQIIQSHVASLQHGGFRAGIASWLGVGHETDQRLAALLQASAGTPLKWATHYLPEAGGDPTLAVLSADLAHLKATYGADPGYLRVAGRPVVFGSADPGDGCAMVERWKQANAGVDAFLVLPTFAGYQTCAKQPDEWYGYDPTAAEQDLAPRSYTVSPGYWLASDATARLERDLSRWSQAVQKMMSSRARWQLVTTFNGWGQGTAVESASEWSSPTGHGWYLDVLHDDGKPSSCLPATCAGQGKNCGTLSDGCGGTLRCGDCTAPATCAGGGVANVCGSGPVCVPKSCAAQGKNCGTVSDGCADTLQCGSCTAPQACGGGGVANVCGTPATAYPVIAVVGDIAGSWSQDEATAKLVDAMKPSYVITTGDNAYGSGAASEFTKYYEPTWGRHRAKTRPSPGNHDHATADLAGYCGYFGAAAGCKGGYGYYSFDVGDWHLISLDSGCSSPSSCADPMASGSAMRQWLTADLAKTTKRCVLAYWHHPRFSSGEHGNDARSSGVWNELYAANADLVLNGHEHDYERFSPQSPTADSDAARGLTQIIVGTGGAAFRTFGPEKPNSVARNATAHGVLKLTLKPDSADYEFVPIAGQSWVDRGTVRCH